MRDGPEAAWRRSADRGIGTLDDLATIIWSIPPLRICTAGGQDSGSPVSYEASFWALTHWNREAIPAGAGLSAVK